MTLVLWNRDREVGQPVSPGHVALPQISFAQGNADRAKIQRSISDSLHKASLQDIF